MKIILTILIAITLNNAALFAHYKYADGVYAKCYLTDENPFEPNAIETCMKQDTIFRILGTLLFTEGSYLEEIL